MRYSFGSVSEISVSRVKRISHAVIPAAIEYHKRSDASEMVNSTNFSMCGGRSEPEAIALIVTIRKRIQYRASIQHSLFTTPTNHLNVMANDDLKQHITSSQDFYALLNIPSTASEAEIRSGWRKTALKHHPDKVGATPENLEKFHLLQIAFDVLSDESTKEQYDNARRAREQKAQRTSAYDEQRKAMIDKLEKGERDHKRKHEEETEFEMKLARLAADGKRRREERTEKMRQEALEEERRWAESSAPPTPAPASNAPIQELERSVTLRFRRDDKTAHLDSAAVQDLFSHFGSIEHTLLRDKKRKVDGEKHKILYCSGLVVFSSIMGALAAVADFPKLKGKDPKFAIIEEVDWADRPKDAKKSSNPTTPTVPATPDTGKVPKFSFKGGSAKSKSATSDEDEKARLRAAEIERIRREDEEEDAAAAAAAA